MILIFLEKVINIIPREYFILTINTLYIILVFRYVRTGQLGHGTKRRPEIIDNKRTYKAVLGDKVGQLVREGPDRFPTAFTP